MAGKWTLLVIRDLCDGPKYFCELERSLSGISPRTLCERLKLLAQHGFVSRTYIKGLPPRTQYELTQAGRALVPLIGTMREVGSMMLQSRAVDQQQDEQAEVAAPAV